MTCLLCSAPLVGQQRKFCSNKCRYTYRDRHKIGFQLTCAECGVGMWRTPGSAPQGQARCRSCRNASAASRPPSYRKHTCSDCGQPCSGKTRCKPCDTALRQVNADPHRLKRKAQRAYQARLDRDAAAPGLTHKQRRELLTKWKRQRRTCIYCDRLATSIDHVVPLARGGTHHEGNLAPCCLRCNSSKLAYTVAEWRHRKRTMPRYTQPPPIKREPRPEPDYTRRVCKVYFVTCECGVRFAARTSRTRLCKPCGHDRFAPPIRLLPCEVCGTDMECKQGRRRYCSLECRKSTDVYREAMRRKRKRWKATPAGRESQRRAKRRQEQRKRAGRQTETLF